MTAAGDAAIDALPPQASALLAGAWGFFWTAGFAMDGRSLWIGAPDIRPATLVNVAYAYELSLKAVLAANGQPDAYLKKVVGHNLKRALAEAVAFGLPADVSVSEQVRLLGGPFGNHSLRYISFGTVELPHAPFSVLERHLGSVSGLLGLAPCGTYCR